MWGEVPYTDPQRGKSEKVGSNLQDNTSLLAKKGTCEKKIEKRKQGKRFQQQ